MSNYKNKIKSKLKEATISEKTVTPDQLKKNTDDLVKTAKDALDIDDTQAKDYVSGFIGETNVDEVNSDVMQNFIKQYGEKKGKQIYYATANKQYRNPETFHTEGEHNSVGRGIKHGMNPEVEADKYEAYRELVQKLAAEEGNDNTTPTTGDPVKLKETEPSGTTNDPVKLKADVAKLLSKLDMSSIAPYLQKIDNPTEQAEVIAQFAEKIGVPKAKLSSVIAQIKTVAESNNVSETTSSRKIIKTIKVKDIK